MMTGGDAVIEREYRETWKCDGCGIVEVGITDMGYLARMPIIDVRAGWARIGWSVSKGSWQFSEFCLCPKCITYHDDGRVTLAALLPRDQIAGKTDLPRFEQVSDEEGD